MKTVGLIACAFAALGQTAVSPASAAELEDPGFLRIPLLDPSTGRAMPKTR